MGYLVVIKEENNPLNGGVFHNQGKFVAYFDDLDSAHDYMKSMNESYPYIPQFGFRQCNPYSYKLYEVVKEIGIEFESYQEEVITTVTKHGIKIKEE